MVLKMTWKGKQKEYSDSIVTKALEIWEWKDDDEDKTIEK